MLLASLLLATRGAKASGAPVVLLHGCCVSGAQGQADVKPLADRITAGGYTVYSLALPSATDATKNAQYAASFISANHLGQVHLVGYSMGGLSVRYMVKNLGVQALSVQLIDSPNNGDFIGCLNSASMCANGSFLKALNAGDDTPGAARYQQLIDTDPGLYHSSYVLDGGVCLTPITGTHLSLPASSDVAKKVVAFLNGTCLGSWR